MPAPLPEGLRVLLSAPDCLTPAALFELGNPPWEGAERRILIVRLSPARDVDRSTPHLVLFSECRRALPEAFLDFAFFPDKRDRELLAAESFPFFYGLASGRGAVEFDLVLVSNAFALELLNLPWLFSTSGMPPSSYLRARARAEAAARGEAGPPLVILGGSNAAAAGSLLLPGTGDEASADCLVDGIFFGEGEGAIGELASLLTEPGHQASARLGAAENVEGLWLALSGSPVVSRTVRPFPPPALPWPLLNTAESSTARLQVTAGCPGFCSFCFEGWDRRPYREVPLDELLLEARKLRARSGAETLEVYSFNFNTHERVFELLFELNRIFRRVNLMSQRLDILARTPGLVRAELAADKRSFTLGVEGISARMRAYYRKGLSEGDLELLLDRLLVPGVRELKLFYIIAGTESVRDLDEFASFAAGLKARKAASAPGLRILVSAGYLSRLPFTPLQHAPLALDESVLRRISGPLKSACDRNGIEFRLASRFDEYAIGQLLALGGREVATWLARVPSRGICFDGSLTRGA